MTKAEKKQPTQATSDDKGDVGDIEPSQGTDEAATEQSISAEPPAGETCPITESLGAKSSSSETPCPTTDESRRERPPSILTSNSSSDPQSSASLGDSSNSGWGDFISAWVNSQEEETRSYQDKYVKPTVREAVCYGVFLLVLTIIVASISSSTPYQFSKAVSDLFLEKTLGPDFNQITDYGDVWKYVRGPLMSGLYPEDYSILRPDRPNANYMYNEQWLLGVPRIRQLKVRSDSCQVADDFANHFTECFAEYSTSLEDTTAFNISLMEPDNTAWHYYSESELNGAPHMGLVGTYSGGGYYADLSTTREASEVIVENLVAHRWIKRGTRAVFIDFTVNHERINMFCVVRLLIEFPATGSALLSWSFHTVRLLHFCTLRDYFILACEILFGFFILFYIVHEILKMRKLKCLYFKSFWNVMDVVIIVISLEWAGFTVYRTVEVNKKLAELDKNQNVYADFYMLGYLDTTFGNLIGVVFFFAWMKILKYFSFNTAMAHLFFTLERSAKSLASYCVAFGLALLGFGHLGFVLFGRHVKEYSSFANSLSTLVRTIIGEYSIAQLEKESPLLGPPFTVGFMFVILVLSANTMMVIKEAYQDGPPGILDRSESEAIDYNQRHSDLLRKLNLQRGTIAEDFNLDPEAKFEEWRQHLKSFIYFACPSWSALCSKSAEDDFEADCPVDFDGTSVGRPESNGKLLGVKIVNKGYDEKQIELIYANYEIAFGGHSDEESNQSNSDAARNVNEGFNIRGRRPGRLCVSRDEYSAFLIKFGSLDRCLPTIVSKCRLAVDKIASMEDAARKRWVAFGQILETVSQMSGTVSERAKREYMERLVREELEEWDEELLMLAGEPHAEADEAANDQGGREAPAEAAPNEDKMSFDAAKLS